MGCCHWFKGQDVTINGYSGQPLIKQDDDYYRDMLIKYYGDTKEPTEVMKRLIANAHDFTRYDRLKKLGYISEVPLAKSNLNEESILGAVRDEVDELASSITDYKEYPAIFIRVIRYLNDNYTNDIDHTKTFKVDIGLSNAIVTDSIVSPEYTINDKKYLIKSNNTNSNYIYLVDDTHVRLSELDKDGNETDTTKDIEFDISTYAKRIAVSYVSGYGDTASDETCCIDSNNIPQDWYQYRGLIIPIKNDGNLIKDDKTLYPALRSLGVALKDMQDSLSSSDIKDAFITYMAKDGGVFKREIEQLYNHFIDLQLDDGNCSMYYHNITKEDNDGIVNTENVVTINGMQVGDAYMDYFMTHKICPIQKLDEFNNIIDKYRAMQEVLSIITHAQEVKHLKWYQTSDFLFGVQIAGAVAAAFSGPMAFMIYGATLAVTEMVLSKVKSPWLRAAIIIALVIAGNWETVSNYSTASVTALSNVGLQVTTALANAREQEIEHHMEERTNEIYDQNKEVNEQINKLRKQAIYHPFLSMDLMFEGPYTLPYANYETIESACTISYDTIY